MQHEAMAQLHIIVAREEADQAACDLLNAGYSLIQHCQLTSSFLTSTTVALNTDECKQRFREAKATARRCRG
jgi:hypothetical protein